MNLAALLAPVSPERFFASHWGRRALVVRRNDPRVYTGLPTVAEFDFLLSSLTSPSDRWFSLVKGREESLKVALTKYGTIDLGRIYEEIAQGYTLLLAKLQKRHRATAALCRALEADLVEHGVALTRSVGANAYFSPRSTQGFPIHYDVHDVFVLQLAGHKRWRIYRCWMDSPLQPSESPLTSEQAGRPVHDVKLSAGDLLYVPRGFPHEASTGGDLSLHLTLSMQPATWRDIFVEILDADARFRRNLPRGFAEGGRLSENDRRRLRAVARAVATSPKTKAAVVRVARRLLEESDILSNDGLTQVSSASKLTSASRVGLAKGVPVRVDVDRRGATLSLPGISFRGDRAMEPVLRRLAAGQIFRVGELPLEANGSGKRKLVADLVRAGYLVGRGRSKGAREAHDQQR